MLKRSSPLKTATKCKHCGNEPILISQSLGLCLNCIRQNFEEVEPVIREAHRESRQSFNLPPQPPKAANGAACHLCFNECQLSEGEKSYCGLRLSTAGKLSGANADKGNVSWYYDALPTNCVADWVCPGGTGSGHPDFLMTDLPTTSLQHAERCLNAAKNAGLHRVRIGNAHLLRNE